MLNVTKVNTQIRNSDTLFWGRDGEFDLVGNGNWIMKVSLRKEKYRKILGLLVEKFALIPSDGETYQIRRRKEPFKQNFDFSSFLEVPESEIKDTRLEWINKFNKRGLLDCRIFKGKEYIYVNTKYIDMLTKNYDYELKWFGEGSLNPVYVRLEEDELLMILPMRMPNDNNHLKEIEKEPIADQNE